VWLHEILECIPFDDTVQLRIEVIGRYIEVLEYLVEDISDVTARGQVPERHVDRAADIGLSGWVSNLVLLADEFLEHRSAVSVVVTFDSTDEVAVRHSVARLYDWSMTLRHAKYELFGRLSRERLHAVLQPFSIQTLKYTGRFQREECGAVEIHAGNRLFRFPFGIVTRRVPFSIETHPLRSENAQTVLGPSHCNIEKSLLVKAPIPFLAIEDWPFPFLLSAIVGVRCFEPLARFGI
jgi:hypothetical protein